MFADEKALQYCEVKPLLRLPERRRLLAAIIAIAALLSAVFSNDIVCLAVAPLLADACLRRGLDPVPYLLALACAANIGSAATLIGNPQNMLIGQQLMLDFGTYLADPAPTTSLVLHPTTTIWPLWSRADVAVGYLVAAAGEGGDPRFIGVRQGDGVSSMIF